MAVSPISALPHGRGALNEQGVDKGLGDVAAELALLHVVFLGVEAAGPQAARVRSNHWAASVEDPALSRASDIQKLHTKKAPSA
jgi:hypothetical protein